MPYHNIYAGRKCQKCGVHAFGDIVNSDGHFYLCYPHWYEQTKDWDRELRIKEDEQWGDQEWYREAFPHRTFNKTTQTKLF